ncbi:MAG: hypothetical protein WCO48_00555 [Candidatus Taylorbacteria bacterium]
MKPRNSIVFVCLVASIITSVVFSIKAAQAQLVPVSISVLQLSILPKNPSPNESVVVKVESYATDISGATISWSANDTVMKKGVGLTTFTTQAPKLGKTLTIQVNVVTPSGQQYNESLPIKSGGVDFITESSGYTPPFFLGRLPVVYENTVRIVAVPHLANSAGVEYDPSTLIYKWEKDSGEVLSDMSGYGKSSIDLKGDIIPRPYSLTVTVNTKDGTNTTKGTVSVIPQRASLVFYVNDSLYGPLYNRSIDTVNLGTQKELSVVAVPFGFDKVLNGLGNLVLNWSINGTYNSDLGSSNNIVLRAPDGSAGSSDINLSISNKREFLQSANSGFATNFSGATDSTNSTSNPVTF